MAIGAVRVMAAGKAGLESLPFFVDELLAQGIPQLAPWAIDHDQDEIDSLVSRTRGRVRGDWSGIFNIGVSPPGSRMETDTSLSRRLLEQINPLAAQATELADSPAQLGAWCRRQINQYCRDTERLWEQFKSREGLTSSYQLAVVIPFCPEGPTSGTVSMYLGAALRSYFAVQGKADQLVVWGIELCPPVHRGESGDMDRMAVQNAFRGFVGRQELLEGVPLSEMPDHDERTQCFDINIVFDGGTARSATTSREVAWSALDRAAAQVTACLLNRAGGATGLNPPCNSKLGSAGTLICTRGFRTILQPGLLLSALSDILAVASGPECLVRGGREAQARRFHRAREKGDCTAADVRTELDRQVPV